MSTLRNINIHKIGGSVPTVGTFGQQIIAYEVRDISVRWNYEVYDTDFYMQPAEITGDGVQSFSDGKLVASSAVTGECTLKSRKITRYKSGYGGYALFTATLNSSTGSCSSGLISENDDIIEIREVNGVVEFGYTRSGVALNYVASTSFNGDADVGAINWTDLNIFMIQYGYLGSAVPLIKIKQNGDFVLLHDFAKDVTVTSPYVRSPEFRQFIKATNGATISAGSWASGVYSNTLETRGEDPSAKNFFHKTQRTISPNATPQPIVSYRSKTTYNGFNHAVLAKLLVARIATSSEGLYEFGFVFDPATTTGGTYVDINTISSVIEVNDSITGYTGGSEAFAVPVAVPSSGTGVSSLNEDFEKLGAFLIAGREVVITVKEIVSGAGTDIQLINFNWQELF